MKIQYASDIHLELSNNSRFIKSMPFEVAGDVLVFAGDTGYLRDLFFAFHNGQGVLCLL